MIDLYLCFLLSNPETKASFVCTFFVYDTVRALSAADFGAMELRGKLYKLAIAPTNGPILLPDNFAQVGHQLAQNI